MNEWLEPGEETLVEEIKEEETVASMTRMKRGKAVRSRQHTCGGLEGT